MYSQLRWSANPIFSDNFLIKPKQSYMASQKNTEDID